MKFLVTGGLGFIGHNIVSKLESLGHEVMILDLKTTYNIIPESELDYLLNLRQNKIKTTYISTNSICNKKVVQMLLDEYTPDVVIHTASFPRQKVVNTNPQLGSRVMIEGLLNLLEYSVMFGVKKFVHLSSSMVYGDFDDYVAEDNVCNPIGQYGIMKLTGEWLVKDYCKNTDLKYTIIRPSAVYGPLDVNDRVVSKFLTSALNGEDLIVNGFNEKLDFTYVDDLVDGIVSASTTDISNNKTYNMSGGNASTIYECAELIRELVGNNNNIVIKDKNNQYPSRGALNIVKAVLELKYNPNTDLKTGLTKYHEWLIQNPTLWAR